MRHRSGRRPAGRRDGPRSRRRPRPGSGTASAPRAAAADATFAACSALLRPYRLRVAAMLFALVLGTCAALAPPLLARLAIDQGHRTAQTEVLVLAVIAFLVSAVLVWATTYAQTYLVGWVGQRALADLRIRIFTHLQSQPIGFYESRPAGVLISRITNDVEALESLVTDSVVTLFQSGLTLIGGDRCAAVSGPQARAADLLHRAVRGRSQHLVPAHLDRRLPAHARDDRLDHGLPAGDAFRDPGGPQLRPGAHPRGRASRSSTRTTARPTWSPCASTPPTSRPSK